MKRNREHEQAWLERIVELGRAAGIEHPDPPAFIRGVIARLDQHGPTIHVRPAHILLVEIAQEALDIPGWGLNDLQAHPRAGRGPLMRANGVDAYRIHARLTELEGDR